jgi:hypothetical protein
MASNVGMLGFGPLAGSLVDFGIDWGRTMMDSWYCGRLLFVGSQLERLQP